MKTKDLVIAIVLALLWAALLFSISSHIPDRFLGFRMDGNLLGFIGAVFVFVPTVVTEFFKWHLRDVNTENLEADTQLYKDLLVTINKLMGRFRCWHALVYFCGWSLIALGFAQQYSS